MIKVGTDDQGWIQMKILDTDEKEDTDEKVGYR